jgi:integrase
MAHARGAPAISKTFRFQTDTLPEFSMPWQQEFIKWLGEEKNHAVATISREMTSVAAAFNHAVKRIVVDDDGSKRVVQLLKYAVPILYKEEEISRLTLKPGPTPRSWLPTWEQMAQFIDTIGRRTSKGEWNKNSENLFRFIVFMLNTWARPEAILEIDVPEQVDFEAGILRLNPPGRKQTKKVRPTIPLTDNLKAWLKHWNIDRPIHRNGEALKSIKKVFKAHAMDLDMPKFTP